MELDKITENTKEWNNRVLNSFLKYLDLLRQFEEFELLGVIHFQVFERCIIA